MTLDRGSFAAMKSYFRFRTFSETDSAAESHAKTLANPTYHNLLKREPLVRHFIPAFIVSILVMITLANMHQTSKSHDETLDDEKAISTLTASLLANKMNALLDDIPDMERAERLQAALANYAPEGATRNGRVLIITDPDGKILAQEPYLGPTEQYVSDIFQPTQMLLTFGKGAGFVEPTLLNGKGKALATSRHLDGSTELLILYQPKDILLSRWYNDRNIRLSIYIGTTLLVLIVYTAFYVQSMRALGADKIYQQTYSFFDTALHHGQCGVWDWDISRDYLFWSPSMFQILGLTPQPSFLNAAYMNERINPQDGDIMAIAEKVIKGEITQLDQTYRMRHERGHWIWVRFQGEVTQNGPEKMPRLAGICVDVSEQVRLARENKTANSRLRDSIESLSEAFVLWDAENRLVVCNQQYRELNQIKPELAVPGAPYAEVMSGCRGPQPIYIRDEKREEKNQSRSFETALSDGRWLQINELRTNDGSYVTIGTDITNIKRSQEELRTQKQELKASIEELTHSKEKLQKLALQNARQTTIAQEANRAKAEFLANISHEWRTPLNAIIGFSDMMKQGAFGPLGNEKYIEYCEDIQKSGEYMLAFINDVLDMSEIEAGRLKLDKLNFDAAMVLNNCITGLENDTKKKQLEITCDIATKLPVHADRRVFKQIILNLLTNAVKFTEENGRISLSAHKDKNKLIVSVRDNGIGISSQQLNEVCKPFKQVQNQFTKNHTGSGLGLAICKSLVELHDGTMSIESELDRGTRVTFTLPLSYEEKPIAEPMLQET